MFLKQDEEIAMIKAINRTLDIKVPYVRRNPTKTTRIRTVIREEPIKLAQYLRGKSPEYQPFVYSRAQVDSRGKGIKGFTWARDKFIDLILI